MYKVLINGKVEEKHIDEIKKIQTTENSDTKDDICDNTILLTKPDLSNSPGKRYPTRNRKPVSRYGREDQQKTKGDMLYTITLNFILKTLDQKNCKNFSCVVFES